MKIVKFNNDSDDWLDDAVSSIKEDGIFTLSGLPSNVNQVLEGLFSNTHTIFNGIESGEIDVKNYHSQQDLGQVRSLETKREAKGFLLGAHRLLYSLHDNDLEQCKRNIFEFDGVDKNKFTADVVDYYHFIKTVLSKIFHKLENDFELKPNALFNEAFEDTVIGFSRFVPMSQPRIIENFDTGTLFTTMPGTSKDIIVFRQHTDFPSLVVLSAQGNRFVGLELQEQNSTEWKRVDFPEENGPVLLVFVGDQLQYLLQGRVIPVLHRVRMTINDQIEECDKTPEEVRSIIYMTTYQNTETLEPALTQDGLPLLPPEGKPSPFESEAANMAKPKDAAPNSTTLIFSKLFTTKGQVDAPLRKREAVTSQEMLKLLMQQYPKTSLYDTTLLPQALEKLPSLDHQNGSAFSNSGGVASLNLKNSSV